MFWQALGYVSTFSANLQITVVQKLSIIINVVAFCNFKAGRYILKAERKVKLSFAQNRLKINWSTIYSLPSIREQISRSTFHCVQKTNN